MDEIPKKQTIFKRMALVESPKNSISRRPTMKWFSAFISYGNLINNRTRSYWKLSKYLIDNFKTVFQFCFKVR